METWNDQDLKREQEGDPVLLTVQGWLEFGQRSAWNRVLPLCPEAKACYSQWDNLAVHNGLLFLKDGGNQHATQWCGSGWCLVSCVPMPSELSMGQWGQATLGTQRPSSM